MEQEASPRRPRIALIVDNHVTVDSRVQKTARAAADAGFDTVIVGRSTTSSRVETVVGGVRTILLPAPRYMAAHAIREPRRGRRPLAYRSREESLDRSRRLSTMRAGQLGRVLELKSGPMGPREKAEFFWLRARVAWRQRLHNRRFASFQKNAEDVANNRGWLRGPRLRLGLAVAPASTWRRVGAELLDYDITFGPELTELEPDLVHAHDFSMLVVATNAKARARQAGRTLHVVHDVHEWIAGAPRRDPVWRKAMHEAEIELIPKADAVITVSDWLADSLQRDCGLAVRPTVITNSPEPPDDVTSRLAPSVRARCGLGEGVPLIVYSGAVAEGRGILTAVEALPQLPGVHLAVVVGKGPNKHYDELLARATDLGNGDRLHRVDYVPQELVVPHLASADIGLIPLSHAVNHEISLITKYREYMHARLPIVVSDVRTMAEYTREHGTGEVFVAGDSADLARAVRTVLEDVARYRAAFTDEMLHENSWPTQAARLVEVYSRLAGQPGGREPAQLVGPPLLPTVTTPVSLVIGPTNMAGQGAAWAASATRHLEGVDAVNATIVRGGSLQFGSDLRISDAERRDPAWVDRFEREVCATRTHALLENALPLHGSTSEPVVAAHHVQRLQAAGLATAFVFHGAEIQDPVAHAERYAWSNFRDADPDWVASLVQRVGEVRSLVTALGIPLFVSTPDLLTDVPEATWMPVVVDAGRFATTSPLLERDVPVVLHAPSRAAKKGSRYIDEVLQGLDDAGRIRYVRLQGVRPERMPRAIASADIVVDQVGIGVYGVFAGEAMAAGRLVISQVGDVVRDHVRSALGREVPIVEASAATLEEVVRSALADRDAARATAAQGPAYVADVHDGRRSAAALAPWLRVAGPGGIPG